MLTDEQTVPYVTICPLFVFFENRHITRESVTQMDAPQIIIVQKGLQVDISNNVNGMLWTNKLSITKGNKSYIMQKRVMALVHFTSPHRDLSNNEVSS